MVRSVLAVLTGIAALTATSFAIEAVVNPALDALLSSTWVRVLTFAYGFLCVAGGGYVAARIAGRLPIRHAGAMGMVQAGLTIMAMLSPEAGRASRWQWIAIAVVSIPAALAGGVLASRNRSGANDIGGIR